jgi:hypothetical protein
VGEGGREGERVGVRVEGREGRGEGRRGRKEVEGGRGKGGVRKK